MRTQWVFRGINGAKQQARSYWRQKAPRLERLLSSYRPSLRELRLTLYRHKPQDTWELRAVLHLPTGTLVAEETASTLTEAIDTVADELARQIRRHKDLVRKEHVYARRRQRRERLSAAGPYLDRDQASGRREPFFELLRPHLDAVSRHARRELKVLEIEGALPRGEITPRDLIDDALLAAYEQFADRPQQTPLDVWLLDLLHRRLQELTHEHAQEELIEAAAPRDAAPDLEDADEDPDEPDPWLRKILSDREPVTWEELIPDEEADEAWRAFTQQEQQARIEAALSSLPAPQRQALTLHVLEGYDLAEIAMIQDRPEAEIAADVQAARHALRERLQLAPAAAS